MNPFLIALLAMLFAALIVGVVALIKLLFSVLTISRHAKALQQHPTMVALRGLQATTQRFGEMPAKVAELRARSARIGELMAQLAATSAQFGLQIDRISFATELMLKTFVPTLRGSMSD